MQCTLMVGDKVTPVDDFSWFWEQFWAVKPSAGVVYTVRSVDLWPELGIGVRLVEITNGTGNDGRELAYNHKIFRRVIDTTYQIAALRRIAIDAAKGAKVPADLVPSGVAR